MGRGDKEVGPVLVAYAVRGLPYCKSLEKSCLVIAKDGQVEICISAFVVSRGNDKICPENMDSHQVKIIVVEFWGWVRVAIGVPRGFKTDESILDSDRFVRRRIEFC